MEIRLYTTLDENNKVSKSLSNERVLEGTLKEEMSIIDPVVLIESDYPTENYVFIPAFSKYYFVKNITSVRNRLWRLDLHEDVLMTFKGQFLDINAIIERQENVKNSYLIDTQAPIEADSQLYIKNLGGSFSTKNNLVIINAVATNPAIHE